MFSYSRIAVSARPDYIFSMPLKLHIREIRKAQGHTLAVVAGRAGISVPHLSEIERGDKNLNNHLMERISAALGVRPEELVSGEHDTPQDEVRARLQKTIHGIKTEDAMRKLAEYAELIAQAEKASGQSE